MSVRRRRASYSYAPRCPPPPPLSRTLKVSSATDVRKLGNSINYIFQEAEEPPTLLAGGAEAINQAIKGVANARQKPIEFDDGTMTSTSF